MTEDKIREIIRGYVSAEMEFLPDPDTLPEHPLYSRRFNRKMKKVMRAGNYFGGHLHLYTTLSRVAAAIIIVLCLAVANQASAAIFGFNPWKEVTRIFFSDVGMEQKTYEKTDVNPDDMAKPVSDVPTYVPEGYSEVDFQKNSTTIGMEWQKTDIDGSVKGIAYSRDAIGENTAFIEDAAYDRVQTTEVAGYVAKIGYKPDRVSISWLDDSYMYSIWTNETEITQRTLKRMSESIYQKNQKK